MTKTLPARLGGLLAGAQGARGWAIVLGGLAGLGQPPIGLWPLTLLALALAFRLAPKAATPRGSALWWFWLGAGYFTVCLFWIVSPFLVDADFHAWMAPFALVLFCGGMALFWGLAGGLGGGLARRFGTRPDWSVALCLSVAELARGYLFGGFPWGTPGHIWIDSPMGQLAALIGPNGLTILTFCLAAALSGLVRWQVGLAALVLVLGFGWGGWLLTQPMPPDRPVTLRLVQPNAEQALKWDRDQARVFFDRLTALSAAKPPVDLVIWPETALPYTMDGDDRMAGLIAASGQGAAMAIGRQRIVESRGWNTLTFMDPNGAIIADYDKARLVPFGEFVPLGDLAYHWFGLTLASADAGTAYTAGEGPDVIDLGPKMGRVMPLICYEAIFPQDLRRAAARSGLRADWLLQVTNDAWFGTLTGPWQHAAQTRLRAIEQGLPMVRVANTGVTAIYDARGREVASLPFGIASYLDHALPGPLPPTFFARWGEAGALVLLAGLALSLIFARRRTGP
jgi:apolipoprotein N-acyltransferase